MMRLLSIMLLMIYSLTSSGATVYYHACGQNLRVSLSEKESSHRTCDFCASEETAHHQHDADCTLGQQELSCDPKGDCCTDVQVELKNSDDQLTVNLLKDFHLLSPAEFIIPWILVFHQSWFDTAVQAPQIPPYQLLSTTFPDTYLVLGNFRI